MLAAVSSVPVARADDEHFLDFSVDNYKVSFISGNLSAAVTYAWPRVIFQHLTDPLSPSFEVGMPTMYLFNDTNNDSLFSRSEAMYTAHLGSFYDVVWNVSGIEFHNETVAGEVAQYRMSAPIALFRNSTDVEASIEDWANITFWFRITENPTICTNSYGDYTVRGKADLRFSFVLQVNKPINCTGLVLEHLLKGGGSSNMFLIREASSRPGAHLTPVYSREDETVNGLDFTHKLSQTNLPYQEINFAKDDNTIQAFYRYCSEPNADVSNISKAIGMNSSYYTTGTGMILHVAYEFSNDTTFMSHQGCIGLDDNGFTVRISDWFKENMTSILAVVGGIIAIVAIAVTLARCRRKKPGPEKASPSSDEKS